MNKIIKFFTACVLIFSLAACGDTKVICGKTYDTYGILSTQDEHDENIRYRVITGNFIWSIVLIETVIFPVYFIGFSIYEPVEAKVSCDQLNISSYR